MKTVTLCTTLVALLSMTTASAEVDSLLKEADDGATHLVGVVVGHLGQDPDDMSCPPVVNEDLTPNRDCYCPQPHDPLGLCE